MIHQISRFLIITGFIICIIGILYPKLQGLGIARLPGDFVVKKDNLEIYIPLTTSFLISVIMNLVFWLVKK